MHTCALFCTWGVCVSRDEHEGVWISKKEGQSCNGEVWPVSIMCSSKPKSPPDPFFCKAGAVPPGAGSAVPAILQLQPQRPPRGCSPWMASQRSRKDPLTGSRVPDISGSPASRVPGCPSLEKLDLIVRPAETCGVSRRKHGTGRIVHAFPIAVAASNSVWAQL